MLTGASRTTYSPVLPGKEALDRTLFLSSRYKDDPAKLQLGLRRGRHKLVLSGEVPTAQLFDLEADPGEVRDISDQHPESPFHVV